MVLRDGEGGGGGECLRVVQGKGVHTPPRAWPAARKGVMKRFAQLLLATHHPGDTSTRNWIWCMSDCSIPVQIGLCPPSLGVRGYTHIRTSGGRSIRVLTKPLMQAFAVDCNGALQCRCSQRRRQFTLPCIQGFLK